MKLLVRFYTFSRAEIELRAAISAVKQTRKQTLSASGGISSSTVTEFLNTVEGIFINDGFLGVGDNLPLILGIMNRLVYLVTDESGFEVYRATRVLSVRQDVLDS